MNDAGIDLDRADEALRAITRAAEQVSSMLQDEIAPVTLYQRVELAALIAEMRDALMVLAGWASVDI